MTSSRKQKKSLMKRRPKSSYFDVSKHLRNIMNHGKIAVVLFFILLLYIIIGMIIFSHVEKCKETVKQTIIQNSTNKIFQEICGKLIRNITKSNMLPLVNKLQENLQEGSITSSKQCEKSTNDHLSDWFEFSMTTIHAIGYGKTPESSTGKITTIFYSIFGILIAVTFYTNTGIFIENLLKVLVYKIEMKLFNRKRKTVKSLHLKSFCLSFMFFMATFIIASATTLQYEINNVSSWLDALYFWWVTMTTVGNGNYRFHTEKSPAHLLLSFLFILIGISFFSSTICIIMDLCKKLHQNKKNKKRDQHPPCCCFFFGKGSDDVTFKDVSTQNWGSLMSINNGACTSAIELNSIDGSLHGGILENTNRVDSQCTIKRLSEIERERSRGAGNESDSENDADDELGIISPIMVTAAVATKRTVNNL